MPGGVAALHGAADAASVDLDDLGLSGWWILGEQAGDRAGEALAAPGDLNGDGTQDLVVAAPWASREFPEQGVVYVVTGSGADPRSLGDVADGVGGFALHGLGAQQHFGVVVAGVGDVDGDGAGDFAVGDPGWDEGRGRVFVVTGASQSIATADVLAGAAGFMIEGEARGDGAGRSISAAGDVNGDGLGDVVVGAWAATSAGGPTGRVYVVHGRGDGQVVQLAEIVQGRGGQAFDGHNPDDMTGRCVVGGSDVDHDGAPDLIVGVPGSDADGPYSGLVRVVPAFPQRCFGLD